MPRIFLFFYLFFFFYNIDVHGNCLLEVPGAKSIVIMTLPKLETSMRCNNIGFAPLAEGKGAERFLHQKSANHLQY